MFSDSTENHYSKKSIRKNKIAEIANTLEWLITAFILAFVFRAFVMEAFRIPTGSMADTLMGAHFGLRCVQCGYKYDYGFAPERYRMKSDTIPRSNVKPPHSRCPNCGLYQSASRAMPVSNGDRILVLKCLYQFFEPKRWDVIVFKNPLEPEINYIKRLAAKPGETVEIIDGDIYINGQIARKPHKVQNEMWMPIYDNDYQPARPSEGSFNGYIWHQPFDIGNSQWDVEPLNKTMFRLDGDTETVYSLTYDTNIGNDFRATYAYNDVAGYTYRPYCSDLKIRFCARPQSADGLVGIALSKYETTYKAWLDFEGNMVIEAVSRDKEPIELAHDLVKPVVTGESLLVEFANVDHQLIFKVGDKKLVYDLGKSPDDAGTRKTDIQPKAQILGSGKLNLSHVALFRDTHYTSANSTGQRKPGRASEGNPFTLGQDEFFALGDNSPNSADCRFWGQKGKGNNKSFFRAGIVPREYLVGKALFVYWPSGFKPFVKSRFALIPNIGRMRFVHGGTKDFK